MKKIVIIIFILFFNTNNLLADTPHFLDFKLILNESNAGKKAQNFLKNKLENGIKSLKDKEKKILEEEKKLIQQKKIISSEDYKKKLIDLRSKVTSLQKERNKLLQSVANQRAKAKKELLENLNPILKEHMKENKIRIVLDKKNILLADETLDITKTIIAKLNKNLKSIQLN